MAVDAASGGTVGAVDRGCDGIWSRIVEPDTYRRALEIFEAVCDLPETEREAVVDERCGGDAAVRELVLRLLAQDDTTKGPDEFRTGSGAEMLRGLSSRAADSLPTPERVGRYQIHAKLGEGGFGVVYRAEQLEPVRREVALKLIKPGMDSKAVVARFEAERQALALMDHPCVAKVLDGGVTEDGRPFFVMDLVRGEPITSFCDREKLRVKERLELFAKVCEAVQHAHSKGVIHRDLKPSNILVGWQDDEAMPKVIDFGIAKALNERLTEASVFTQVGQMIGTPAYMSPEQAGTSNLDIDTRSDVYSLGVLLYELLTGQRPFEAIELIEAALPEMQRIIREVDPPKPSMRVSTTDDAESVAANRRTELRGLSGVLRRDLDWVVMKCLEKDRARRYASASELGAEIGRFLADEPVIAGPPSATYKVSKFVRRHRASVAVSAVLVATLAAGVIGTMVGLARAASAEGEARREAVRKLDAADFLTRNLITEISPYETGLDTKAVDLLDAAAARVERDLGGDPLTEAVVRQALGVAFRDLGGDERGRQQLERAVALFDELAGSREQAALESSLARFDLAGALWRLGDTERARELSEEAVAELRGRLEPADRRLLLARSNLASAVKHAGDLTRAEELYREVLSDAESADVEEGWRTTAQYNLALAVQSQGRAEEAREIFERVLGVQAEEFGESSAIAVRTRSELASCYARLGRWNDSEALFERVLPELIEVFGADHPRTVEALANRGVVALRRGDAASGAAMLADALERLVRTSTWGHPNATPIVRRLVSARAATGDIAGAIAAADAALTGLAASDLDAATVQERAQQVACSAAEALGDVDPTAAARFQALCSP